MSSRAFDTPLPDLDSVSVLVTGGLGTRFGVAKSDHDAFRHDGLGL
ncbi:MAG: hypothetical protein GDA49_10195 [Rhodospirillales bacterium]|nr:hypothetical protein [Rhodospirillales bacterium]